MQFKLAGAFVRLGQHAAGFFKGLFVAFLIGQLGQRQGVVEFGLKPFGG
ncbi:MAG TPA: hypothetical protein PK643_06070 [Saprospiraceae bacterium]|nr:hypothetical protein [Saprospiraceae bacterium]